MQAIGTVFLKEVVDNLRDRRSLFMAVIYPFIGALLLGLLLWLVGGMLQDQAGGPVIVALEGAEDAPELTAYLRERGVTLLPPPADPMAAVRRGEAQAVLMVPPGFGAAVAREMPTRLQLLVNTARLSTVISVGRLMQWLRGYRESIGESRLAARGISRETALPFEIDTLNVGRSRSLAGFFLNMLPPFIVFTVFVGGVYLAIDSTAGERERGSMEPLLTVPVPRWQLMAGKAAAAAAFTAWALLVQLAAFKLMFVLLSLRDIGVDIDPDVRALARVFVVAVPLVLFAVALQIIVAAMSRSYKETQTYLGLLPLLPSLPGLVLIFVPLETQPWMLAIPTFGQVLLIGQLVRAEPVAASAHLIAALCTLAGAALLFCVAARLYQRERLVQVY